MFIEDDLLIEFGGEKKTYAKGEYLFKEGGYPKFFFQVADGKVKMSNTNDDSKEFIHRVFSKGESFGEPPLIGDFQYPADAIAITKLVVWKLPITGFIELVKNNFDIHWKLTQLLAKRLSYKSMLLVELSTQDAEHRIMEILNFYKKNSGKPETEAYEFPYTRQQLADMSGLRVETVIRTTKGLEEKGIIQIKKHKILIG
ncbi:Crp/Fnr family transcriptional regulator [Flexithrix dorotheae]|uniref:Crp/Fnr family transcriptional regulator n=1 Tax=Flexithrix dorotheae TaxID=70993 RepID=UPI00036C9536|nr:Crp/Fnr family transcriptional regulator [Flexithrix dorotheae]